MTIKSLENIDFTVLMDCFLIAFENYFVKMPTDHEYYKERWKIANVQLSASYGMFDNDTLVGFIIHAIGKRNGQIIAFNTGTGVIPSYRGKRIVNSIYEYALPELKNKGIDKCSLEVIKDNIVAIKAYERIGFSIVKNYKCYSGKLVLKNRNNDFELKKVNASFFDWNTLHQDYYSWDNHIETVKQGEYGYFIVEVGQKQVAYFIMNPKNGYVSQFDVLIENEVHWKYLFSAIHSVTSTIKINNVDERLDSKIKYLKEVQLKNTVDQFEMEFNL